MAVQVVFSIQLLCTSSHVKHIAIGTGGLGFISLTGQISHSVSQALSREDGPHLSLHASA